MSEATEIKNLARLIDAIARRCWRGIPSLLGKAPMPTRQQLKEALFSRYGEERVKVRSGLRKLEGHEFIIEDLMIDNADPILGAVRWKEIVEAVRWYHSSHRMEWTIYTSLVAQTETGRAKWGNVGAARRLAQRYDISLSDVYDIARKTPLNIAKAVSMGAAQMTFNDVPECF